MANLDLIPSAPGVPGDTVTGAAGGAATITYAAVAQRHHVIGAVYWSYSAAPTGGSISIEDVSGTVVWGPFAITAAGPGYMPIYPALRGQAVNTAMLVKLAAPGGAVVGVVGSRHWTEPGQG